MKTVLVTPPTYYPLTLAEAKKQLNIDDDITNDDGFIQGLIAGATAKVEQFLRRRLITQTWKLFLDKWPAENYITLPFGELQSVTHVKYTDTDESQTTWSTDDYSVDTDSDPGRIVLNYGKSYPSASLWPLNPIEIQFVCGYGDHAPQTITGATKDSPIVLTVTAHGRTANDTVLVESVAGNTAANGIWKITAPDANNIGLLTSIGSDDYTSGGRLVNLTVPEPVRSAIKLVITDLYENREPAIIGTIISERSTVGDMFMPFKLWGTS